MSFLAPEVLIGLLTALIPLILHLLFRKKPKIITLPTLRFIRMANRKVLKRHRLKRRLLLLVRMLLLGITAFAMARPLIHNQTTDIGGKDYRDLVLVIDNSYFTAARFDGEPLLDHIRRDAAELINAASRGTAVVLTCANPESPNVSLSVDKAPSRAQLRESTPQEKTCDIQIAVSKALQLLMDPEQSQESGTIIVLSTPDRLKEVQLQTGLEDRVTLQKLNIIEERAIDNTAITEVIVRPSPELGADFWQVDASIIHFGVKARTVDLTLTAKPDIRIVSSVTLEPNEPEVQSFQFAAPMSEQTKGRISLDADTLTYDDQADFWLIPNQTIQVLAINGELSSQPQEDELFYFKTAISDSTTRSNEFDLRTVALDSWTSRQWNRPDIVVLANPGPLPAVLAAQLDTFVRNGGGLIVTLGDQVDVDTLNRQLASLLPRQIRGLRRAGDAAASDQGRDRKPARISGFREDHKVLAQIPNPEDTSISQAKVSNYALFSTDVTQDVEEVIRLDEGAPLVLASTRGEGRVVVLSTSIDREWTDLPIQPDFVPLTMGLLRYAANRARQVSQTLKHGSRLKLQYQEGEGLRFKLETPGGQIRTVDIKDVDGRWRIIDDLARTGHYIATNETGKIKRSHYFSVLPNTDASDLRQSQKQVDSDSAVKLSAIENQKPNKLWPFALLLLFVLLGLESQMAYGVSQKET